MRTKTKIITAASKKQHSKTKSVVGLKYARMLKNMVANGGKQGHKSISQTARDAGYSEAYIRSGKLQKTKAWRELMDDAYPDEELLNIHHELLYASRLRHIQFPPNVKDKEIKELLESQGFTFSSTKRSKKVAIACFFTPDSSARFRALDMAYKIKGKYKHTPPAEQRPYKRLSDEELDQEIAEALANAVEAVTQITMKKE